MNARFALMTLAAISLANSCKEPEIDLNATGETSGKAQNTREPSGITSSRSQTSRSGQTSTKSSSLREGTSLPAADAADAPLYVFKNAAQLDEAWAAKDYEATQELFSDWLAQDEAAAINYLMKNVEAKDAVHYAPSIKSILSEIDPEAVLNLLTPLQERRELYLNVATKPLTDRAKNDPETVYAHLEELEDDLTQRELARKLGSAGAFGRGQSAIEWAESQEESPISHAILTSSAEYWLQTNGSAATEFISQSENAERFAEAVTRHINNYARRNPKGMMDWAQSISNESLSQIAVDQAGQRWLDIDPDGFEKWQNESFEE